MNGLLLDCGANAKIFETAGRTVWRIEPVRGETDFFLPFYLPISLSAEEIDFFVRRILTSLRYEKAARLGVTPGNFRVGEIGQN